MISPVDVLMVCRGVRIGREGDGREGRAVEMPKAGAARPWCARMSLGRRVVEEFADEE